MQTLQIVKIGGNIIENSAELESFLRIFAELEHPRVLVHGGGNAASDLCTKLNIPIQMEKGRRITDRAALDVAVMVYAGLVNKQIVAKLQSFSCNALGLSGADLNVIPAQKRKKGNIDYGFVGDIKPEAINTGFIARLSDEGVVPVFPAITHDQKGQLLNTNADTIASALAIALLKKYRVHLNYCFEKPGVLERIDDNDSWISRLTEKGYARLKKEGVISEGMIPKIDTAFEALRQNVHRVYIKHAKNLTNHIGTELVL